VFAEAQDLEVSINFHLGFGKRTKQDAAERVGDWMKRDWDLIDFTKGVCLNFTNNISTVCDLVLGGVCERFPRLTFVSVESGFGWAPFVLDTMDWQWANNGCHEAFPGRLLPSEYFKRQILTTFWFEKSSFDLIEPFADSVMFETDYPHPTSLAPGPASSSRGPRQTIEANLGGLSEETRRKVLFENADRVYAAR
jgi:predicted TIM-barrel fold metal-dependent hydrolase